MIAFASAQCCADLAVTLNATVFDLRAIGPECREDGISQLLVQRHDEEGQSSVGVKPRIILLRP